MPELKTYVQWEKATDVVMKGHDTWGIKERFKQIMEYPDLYLLAVPKGQSPADGSLGKYGLMFDGVYVMDGEDGVHHVVKPIEYKGVVCHSSSNRGNWRIARQAASRLGLDYKGKTQ